MESSKNQIVTLVPLRGLDLADRTFAVAPKEFDLVSSSLLDSIRKRGVLVPVRLVAIGGGRLRIVSGFRRVAAALDCGWEEIPALIEEEPE
ncbi:MAG: ParB N-terminal domain-containing protein, partial [Acidobacteriota bacterium]